MNASFPQSTGYYLEVAGKIARSLGWNEGPAMELTENGARFGKVLMYTYRNDKTGALIVTIPTAGGEDDVAGLFVGGRTAAISMHIAPGNEFVRARFLVASDAHYATDYSDRFAWLKVMRKSRWLVIGADIIEGRPTLERYIRHVDRAMQGALTAWAEAENARYERDERAWEVA